MDQRFLSNIACLPSKNVIHSVKVASIFLRSGEFGISKEKDRVNMSAIRDRKFKMVAGLVDMHLDIYKKTRTELVMGSGRFVEIEEPILEFDVVVRYQMSSAFLGKAP